MMNSRRYLEPALRVAVAATLMLIGCTQGDNPVDPPVRAADDPETQILGFPVLEGNPWNDPTGRVLSVAYASDTLLGVPQQPFPVLYLLHDYGSWARYFEQFNIQSILDDLYRKGEIGRMLVVTVDASNYFGGSYYRNSAATGQFADLIMSTISVVEQNYRVYTQGGRASRAISGHGMGGFGAMRFAMDYPGLFGSVSSMSGPLSFGGSTGHGGVLNWWNQVFAENHVSIGNDSAFKAIYLGAGLFTNQLLAMSAAFSPRPLERLMSALPTDSCRVCLYPLGFCPEEDMWTWCKPCSLYATVPEGPTTILFPTLGQTRTCSDSLHKNPAALGIDLPFSSSSERDDSVWASWLAQDIRSSLDANPHIFDTTAVYFDCGDADEWGFLEQNLDLESKMNEYNVAHTWEQYSGFGGLPAGHSQFVQERLREIIKFHDKLLKRPPGPKP